MRDAREAIEERLFVVAEGASPILGGFAKGGDVEAGGVVGKALELDDAGGQEEFCAPGIAAAIMMKRSGHLDEALEEGFVRLGFEEPDFLPYFVRFEKFAGVEVSNAALEFVGFFGGMHRGSGRVPIKSAARREV